MIRVACPHCGRTYRTMTEGMGKTAVCTKCRQAFRIGQARPKFEWKQTDLGEDSWIGVPAPAVKKEIKHCIMCEAPLDEGAVRCLACGVNQVTGIVERSAIPRAKDGKVPVWSMVPVRLIAVGVVAVLLGAGVYRLVRSLSEDTHEMGVQLRDVNLTKELMEKLREGADDWTLAREYRGRVTDENLSHFVKMLSSDDRSLQQAATLLIGWGDVTQIAPIVEMAESSETSVRGTQVLRAIGVRRLVALSVNDDAAVRHAAAQALCLLLPDLGCDDGARTALAAAGSEHEKKRWLTQRSRPYPEATGGFAVIVGETPVDYGVEVEQIGPVFFIRFRGGETFSSSLTEGRIFDIPIERWCAAAAGRPDVTDLGRSLGGSVQLGSPTGVGWEGTVTVRARKGLPNSIPGLPIEPPEYGKTVEAPIRLERP